MGEEMETENKKDFWDKRKTKLEVPQDNSP
jgi:hypothetical protein